VATALLAAATVALGLVAPTATAASPSDPLFVFAPTPPSPPAPAVPPPTGFLNDPCGVAVDSSGRFYVSDYHHGRVDVYDQNAEFNDPGADGTTGYLGQLNQADPLAGPCEIALDTSDRLYVNDSHQAVLRFGALGAFGPGTTITGGAVDASHPTGVAVDPATGRAYVDQRTYIAVYEPSGAIVEEAGEPVRIGLGDLGDGYGAAVSAYPGTAGFVYVADAQSDTVKVYDPAGDPGSPVEEITGADTPTGKLTSLREASIAVDRATGEIYVTDDLQPADTESPAGLVDVFSPTGAYEGHLKYKIVLGEPSGLAVDNSSGVTQGRVYVTSGNTHLGAIYAYPPGAATTAEPLAGSIPPRPAGGNSLFPVLPIGGAVVGGGGLQIDCNGDACQILPTEPRDPPLTTLVSGLGNPRVHYRRYARHHSRKRLHHHRKRRHHHRHRPVQSAASEADTPGPEAASAAADRGSQAIAPPGTAAAPRGAALPAPSPGFGVEVRADGGAPAGLAGSHPYGLGLTFGQGPGSTGLRSLSFGLPTDLLADPAAAALCSAAAFAAPRSSPFEGSASGESCPASSQVGTVQIEGTGGLVRRFGLFQLEPPDGVAARFGAAPFGRPLIFDAALLEREEGSVQLELAAREIPQALSLPGLSLTLWGVPWDATRDGERGNCLNESEPSFPWAKCSVVGEPATSGPPLALLTLPTECGQPLAFTAQAESWSGAQQSAESLNRNDSDQPVLVEGCETLDFKPGIGGGLTTKVVSTSSGFALDLTAKDPGFIDPRARAEPRTRSAVVRLPAGVTLNPSLGAGLEGCTPGQLAAASAVQQGCPNASKIGDARLSLPFYKGTLKGAVYLAQPYDNPYSSLLAVYLIVKAADRGIFIEASGKLSPDPGDGTITARFDGLTQLPYAELKLELRSGQRAPLVSPPSCNPGQTRIELTPRQGGQPLSTEVDSPVEVGIGGASCPTGRPPFHPRASAGAVNSSANSYTPYFIHLSRSDDEQEITSYSLGLPAGITGKLAGIPFCSDAAIAAARANRGFAEAASSSCPAASRVGRTVTGYGVGPSLAYSEGKIYLAGPYRGAPLSLVTINPATVGPFDLGTVVIRSAFDLDPHTGQLQIDSRSSDPIPHIIDGVVLHIRDIRVFLDRSQFTHNPSSCEPSQLISTLTGSGASFEDSSDDPAVTVSASFQLLNCRSLGFRPKLGLRLRGSSRRGGFPQLRATFAARGAGDSNLRQIEVDLPHQLFLAQEHIRAVCTRAEFAAERCPADSVYGTAVAYTPLLDQPLRGNVYLRSSSGRLPDLVSDLHSGSIRIELDGSIGPTRKGGVRTSFDALPDAPIERFTLTMRGGRRSLFTNSVDICRRPPTASVRALGQNHVGAIFTTRLRGQCGHNHIRPTKQGADR